MKNCKQALDDLNRTEAVSVESVSRYYFTEPMEYSDQPWFVNAAAKILTRLDPQALLEVLKSIELEYGRQLKGPRFGPRPLDFDIIFFNNIIVETPQLIVPHPRMHYREFVLRPINDLSPGLIHPVFTKSMRFLLETLSVKNQKCLLMEEMVN